MASADARHARVASNQELFDRLDARSPDAEDRLRHIGDHAVFLCECSRHGCAARIGMWLAEYEAVRAGTHRFVVAPSDEHVLLQVERVVEKTERYFVVEAAAPSDGGSGSAESAPSTARTAPSRVAAQRP